jgi:hypothetical protein
MMARKPLDLPMAVAKSFHKDLKAYHAEPNQMRRAEIVQRQLGRAPWLCRTERQAAPIP